MRLFVAIRFTPEVRETLLRAIADLRTQARSGNFTRPENLHLTLAFIGETDDWRGAAAALGECVRPDFRFTVGDSGRFGDLWWAGIRPCPELSDLAEAVQTALRARGFGIETRPFRPHITLARELRADGPVRLEVPPVSMDAGRLSLMRSERVGGRLVYTEVCGRDLTRPR